MKKQLFKNGLLTAFFLVISIGLMAQSNKISGTVESDDGDPLVGVNIVVIGSVVGTTSDIDGNFSFTVKEAFPIKLKISMVGYETKQIEATEANASSLKISLPEQSLMGQEVVVSASRMEESILESPVTVEKMGILAIKNTPSANFYDGLADLKGIQMTASSMTFKAINTRGFATMANIRFVQLIDGMDNAAPGLNFPMGNAVGISDLDAEGAELVPGAASALYGPNAFNGILLMTSKNPFNYQGLSAVAKSGISKQTAAGTNPFYDFSLRYAKAFNDKFAFKVNFSYLTAEDWHAADYSQLATENPGQFNTNANGVNVYGDAIATTLNFDALAGTPSGVFGAARVARTGYNEADLIDYNTKSMKGSVGLNYRLTDNMELSYDYRYGKATTVYQGFSRYALKNLSLQQHKIELKGDNFFLRAYGSFEDAGDAYDSRFAAWNINRSWKADTQWFQEYAGTYIGSLLPIVLGGGLPTDADKQAAHDAARSLADTGRLLPGSTAFEAKKKEITELADLATGSKFIDRSKMYHAEGSYNFKNEISVVDLVAGAHFRQYVLNSSGTIFNDASGPISISEYGGYAQASKKLMNDQLKLGASVRYDKNENFDGQFSPRAFAVWSADADKKHNIRASYQTGFRNPDTQSQFIGLDLGPATLVGGTQKNLDMYSSTKTYNAFGGVDMTITGESLYNNSYTASSASAFGAAFPGYVGEAFANGATTLTEAYGMALAAHGDELVIADTKLIKPEQIKSVELGYKGVINNKLMLDLNFYHSTYTDFQLINTVVTVPAAAGDVNDPAFSGALGFLAMGAAGETRAYQLYTNIADPVTSNGFGAGLNYLFPKGYDLGGSYNYADFSLDTQSNPDNIPGFNTPTHRYKVQFGNREAFDNFGFNISYRWSGGYDWTSTFAIGQVEAFSSLDMQVSYKLSALKSVLKVGATNILGKEYVQAYGAPAIGSMYFLSLTFDEMFNK